MALKNVFSFLETVPKHCSQDSSKVQQRQEHRRDQTGPDGKLKEAKGRGNIPSTQSNKAAFMLKQVYTKAGRESNIY